MTRKERLSRRVLKAAALMTLGGPFMLGFVGECDDKLVQATRYVDPCGTILNCSPGYFETVNAEIGDWAVDPTCPLPGGWAHPGDRPCDWLGRRASESGHFQPGAGCGGSDPFWTRGLSQRSADSTPVDWQATSLTRATGRACRAPCAARARGIDR